MSGNLFGRCFRVMNFGESHGVAVGAVIDGCPAGLELSEADIQPWLDRRRPGQSHLVSQRKERDRVEILSGVAGGVTLGTPLALVLRNEDAKSGDYAHIEKAYRPSHADFSYDAKYGLRAVAGGGRSSARVTAGWVAAGAVAMKLIRHLSDCDVMAWVARVGDIAMDMLPEDITREAIEANPVRCPDPQAARAMEERILAVRKAGDSVGGVVEGQIRGLPAGLGEPVYDKFEAELAKAMLSINASKGFEFGSGFSGTAMLGSQHNDPFILDENGRIATSSNRSGGVQGGISNGMPVYFRVAFKPTSTILQPQETLGPDGRPVTLEPKGRHDPCVLPRAVPVVEAMAALVVADFLLRQRLARL
jgi:chorismate synthase